MPRTMSDERLAFAIERLQLALERAQAAGAVLEDIVADERATGDSLRGELDGLAQRHRRLRLSTVAAIERLDGLMATAEDADG